MTQRPKRQRKADRLLSPGSTAKEIECDFALAPMDRLATEMERKWGIEQLPEKVSVETARKYGATVAKLNEAINAEDPVACADWAERCIKGLRFMDQEAEASGAPKIDPTHWEFRDEETGFHFVLAKNERDWPAIREGVRVVTLREAAVAIQRLEKITFLEDAVKEHFPKANVTKYKTETPDDQFEF